MTPALHRRELPATEKARAKLTISLSVTGVRSDGYHVIDAEMITLDLADRLDFTEGEGLEIVDAVHGAGLAVDSGPNNLVMRALALAGATARVRLEKRIPAGAGLGGGSADAAAVLRWAGIDDVSAAASLGADVPFCVAGGAARVRGIGDEIEPVEPSERHFVLLTPPFGVPTAAAYREWDRMGSPVGDGPNDLEPAVLSIAPEMARWRDLLEGLTGRPAVLAGSGSTWFAELADSAEAARLAENLAESSRAAEATKAGGLVTVARTDW